MLAMSSPLNPHRSSSPMSSPTPLVPKRQHARQTHARHAEPLFPRSRSSTGSTSQLLFPEPGASAGADRTTPVESAMWRDRFRRRCAENERRSTERRDEVLKHRRSYVRSDAIEEDQEARRRAELEDEEIFRRMIVHQRKRAEHERTRSFEQAVGGSDDLNLDPMKMWEEQETEYDRWQREAAQAELAERASGKDVDDMDVDSDAQGRGHEYDMFDDTFDWDQVLAMEL